MEAIVLGAGGHAKVVIATLRASGSDVAAAFDDADPRPGPVLGVRVAGRLSDAGEDVRPRVIAIGDNAARARVAASQKGPWMRALHPTATLEPSADIGEGSVVFARAVLQPHARVGRHAIVNTGAILEHDVVVGDFAHVAPGAVLAGGAQAGEGAFVGAGAIVCPGVTVGAWSVLGAGAVVTQDVPPRHRAIGVPARSTPLAPRREAA